ncbi:hypothetical protein Memar_1437 [Methanoculleus marisnigri JR1]|uniref:Uncharacterized protein n=1 Tax=Methanoculleus marisnigri (strain ATCC 35101 / DSM 1498 / JR1) TaxID=368407 RepID=A3CVG6_METMJ|nr:hypothetical protein Memar_1437 [Methanoculleus marisnigri JR1]
MRRTERPELEKTQSVFELRRAEGCDGSLEPEHEKPEGLRVRSASTVRCGVHTAERRVQEHRGGKARRELVNNHTNFAFSKTFGPSRIEPHSAHILRIWKFLQSYWHGFQGDIAIGGTTLRRSGVRAPKVRGGADGECDGRNARSSTTVRWGGGNPLPCPHPPRR